MNAVTAERERGKKRKERVAEGAEKEEKVAVREKAMMEIRTQKIR